MGTFKETVNELVGKLEQNAEGKWELPAAIAEGLSEETMFAVTAERRYRDTQGAYTKAQQEAKRNKAIAEGLEDHILNSEVSLSREQKLELNKLRTENPDEWRKKLNEYETQAKTSVKAKLTNIAKESANKSELEIRQEQMTAWVEATGIQLTKEIIENELPPKFTKDLEAGKITFQQYLEQAATFLQSKKIIQGSEDDTDDDTISLARVAGGHEPDRRAEKGDFVQTYEKTTF